ncbi:hypothetical protein [Deinococcus aquiradiocola]|uniref:Lipoprotein n=1 Tax=Deinococcus aquiradiocola TaxID=393059 RepID=A0A917USE0_9DEIO|nr:hypothetical protein [Deinococcus aquiradiocola]GGJ81640.1 hypothetical protein GCM10008939_26970 [Deinococcus aquiradiocola]
MTRTFPALHLLPLPLLAALALLPGNTAHAQTAAPPMKVTTRTCGAYTVRLAQNGFDDPPDRAAVLQGDRVVASVQDTAVEVQFCRDVTGDGVPELMLMGYSGGAHCCSTHTLYALTRPPRQLMSVFSADTPELVPRQLDGRGPLELLGLDWRFAYAYDLSFAGSPALPRVYSYLQGHYVDNTRAFPGVALGRTRRGTDIAPGEALNDYATLLVFGRAGQADTYLQGLPDTYRAWLSNYAPDIRQNLSDFGLQDWPVRAGLPAGQDRIGVGGAFSAPLTTEYLALVQDEQGSASLRLYRPQGAGITAGPALLRIPFTSDYGDGSVPNVLPVFTVRRADGRDDAVLRDARSGSVTYRVWRVNATSAVDRQDDALVVATRLMADLSSLAGHVAATYSGTPRTATQRAEAQRRVQVALARAERWRVGGPQDLPLERLGAFTVDAVWMPEDTGSSARVLATVDAGTVAADQKDEYVASERRTLTVNLSRGEDGWQVSDWTLAPREGSAPDGG